MKINQLNWLKTTIVQAFSKGYNDVKSLEIIKTTK